MSPTLKAAAEAAKQKLDAARDEMRKRCREADQRTLEMADNARRTANDIADALTFLDGEGVARKFGTGQVRVSVDRNATCERTEYHLPADSVKYAVAVRVPEWEGDPVLLAISVVGYTDQVEVYATGGGCDPFNRKVTPEEAVYLAAEIVGQHLYG